jgi:hypothetical protein
VIAAHTFSLLFLHHKWSDCTCYIVLIASWALLSLQVCIENFILADPKGKGPYLGISGYWCWITPQYPIERSTTSYLYMFIAAAFSFIVHFLVFFRLRGNIAVSAGYKICFQRRPRVRVGRTSNGAYVMTDDRRVDSHLTTMAKRMLYYPIVYTILVLPLAASRFSEFSGISVPFGVTIFAAAVFVLHGFVNMVLFCTTRNILPGSWRQRLGLGTRDSTRGLSSRTNGTWQSTLVPGTTSGTIGTEMIPVTISVGVEKNIEVKHDKAESDTSFLKFDSLPSPTSPTSPTLHTPLFQAYSGGGQRADANKHHIRQFSLPTPQDARTGIPIEQDQGDQNSDFRREVGPASKARTAEWEIPRSTGRALGEYESGTCRPPQAPAFAHPFATAVPVNTNIPQTQSWSPILTKTAGNHRRPSWAGEDSGSGMHWTGYN